MARLPRATSTSDGGAVVEALIARVSGDASDALELVAAATIDRHATLRALTGAIVSAYAQALARAHGLAPTSLHLQRFFAPSVDPKLSERLVHHALATPMLGSLDDVEALGRAREAMLDLDLQLDGSRVVIAPTAHRRRSGAHYTPASLALRIVDETLAPIVARSPREAGKTWAIRVCDPAMGSGAFLLATLRWLVAHAPEVAPAAHARAALAGVDLDPLAVEVARWSIAIEARDLALIDELDAALVVGDALADALADAPADALAEAKWGARTFDAIVGNPPWVSFAGRAAQPLEPARRIALKRRFASFHGYPSLHGVFVERAAELLAPAGRLGLLVPSSMSELAKYGPARRALDGLCVCDDALVDLGDGPFDGVFQPCMILLATRRTSANGAASEGPWPVARGDLDAIDRRILDKLDRAPLPAALFGERGLQSEGDDADHWREVADATHSIPLRCGSDVRAFARGAPSLFADAIHFGRRLRNEKEFKAVSFFVRQTARVPIAARSDGGAFRNSLLAGFASDEFSADFLVAWLNSRPIRYAHYQRRRDARNGMPQMKIAHLRALPAPPDRACVAAIEAIGRALGDANRGVDATTQNALDGLVARAFDLDAGELVRVVETMSRLR